MEGEGKCESFYVPKKSVRGTAEEQKTHIPLELDMCNHRHVRPVVKDAYVSPDMLLGHYHIASVMKRQTKDHKDL
jgi:hypothetical protein